MTHQLVHSFILEELREGAGHRWHREPRFLLSQLCYLLEAAMEMIVRLAGHVHVAQCEVQPERTWQTQTSRKTRSHYLITQVRTECLSHRFTPLALDVLDVTLMSRMEVTHEVSMLFQSASWVSFFLGFSTTEETFLRFKTHEWEWLMNISFNIQVLHLQLHNWQLD